MNITLKPHWAARLAVIDRERRWHEELIGRARTELAALIENLCLDAGVKVVDYERCDIQTADGETRIVLTPKPQPATPAAQEPPKED